MKIAVYAIARNEAKFAERFVNAVRDADLILVADTGSLDDTVDRLRAAGAYVLRLEVTPQFRFDQARNSVLEMVPPDIDVCVSLDLDEVPRPGWRAAIEKAWTPGTTLLKYLFVWSHHPDGSPDITFYPNKVHARHGYTWRFPVHEVLCADDPAKEVIRDCAMIVDHWPDPSKSRSNYLPLLELSAKENPDEHRAAFYLGREYMYAGQWAASFVELERYLDLRSATWYIERCAAMRFIARCYIAMRKDSEALRWYLRACGEAWDQREPWIELGNYYYDRQEWSGAYYAAQQALKIQERPKHYLTEAWAWNHWPGELLSKCATKLRIENQRERVA